MPETGHNGGPPMNDQVLTPEQTKQLRQVAEFIDTSLDEIAERQEDISEALKRAKEMAGLAPADVRAEVMRRRKHKKDPEKLAETESRRELYRAALDE